MRYVIINGEDSGQGIDKGIMLTLFTKYGGLSTEEMAFGRYLAKKIIEAQHSMLWAQNKAGNYGENGNYGVTFSFR
ncbi:MAG: hypothetical protein L0H53_04255 [Candidatus Nitrosocosmicus sp.]|nr:hypothetical protein [Candidatus Nitrosocosmicus sp.]MDN5868305.1 hypothetical protein [Candidatus Nitrosocosmicus sp.]